MKKVSLLSEKSVIGPLIPDSCNPFDVFLNHSYARSSDFTVHWQKSFSNSQVIKSLGGSVIVQILDETLFANI